MLKKKLFAAAMGAAVLSASLAARGQALADRVPSDAVVYVGWEGSDALGTAYDSSHLKQLLETFKLPELAGDAIKAQSARQGNNQDIQDTKDFFAAIARSPSAFFMGPFDAAGDQPQPRVAFFARVGKESAAGLAPRLTEAMKRNPQNDGKSEAVAAGEFLLIESKNINLRDRLTGAPPADNLAAQDAFKQTLARLGPAGTKSALVGYVDGPALLATINDVTPKIPDPQKAMPAIISWFGLPSLRQVAWAGNFDGADWQSAGFVGMRDHRNGVLAFLDSPPLTDASLKLIPRNATEAGAFRFDGMRALQDVTDAAAQINDNMPKQMEQVITEIYKFTGIDMKRDLFPSLGDEFIYYSSAQAASNSIRGLTLVNRLRDPVKAQTAADNVENFINLLILQRDPDSKMQFKARPLPAPLDKIEAHEMTVDRIMPSWAIVDGTLYIAMSEEALMAAIQQASAPTSIRDNPVFAGLVQKLGQEKYASFDFVDLPKATNEMYRIAQRDLAAANPAPSFTLPALAAITPAMSPVLSLYWSDQDGFHAKSTEPFPLAGYLRPSEYLWISAARQAQTRRAAQTAPSSMP